MHISQKIIQRATTRLDISAGSIAGAGHDAVTPVQEVRRDEQLDSDDVRACAATAATRRCGGTLWAVARAAVGVDMKELDLRHVAQRFGLLFLLPLAA